MPSGIQPFASLEMFIDHNLSDCSIGYYYTVQITYQKNILNKCKKKKNQNTYQMYLNISDVLFTIVLEVTENAKMYRVP